MIDNILFSRIGDMLHAARRGDSSVSPFLTPEEAFRTEEYLRKTDGDAQYFYAGGYQDAERKRLFILSAYSVFPEEELAELERENTRVLRIRGSGYVQLNHRSFLGALLALGLERDSLGDILVQDERDAILFCDSAIADFLLSAPSPLSAVGKDKVKVEEFALPPDFAPQRPTQPISDTVSSPRLDAVVAALCGLSREKAKNLVQSEQVRVNYTPVANPSAEVSDGDLISITGSGRYKIESITARTKKDRIRLLASKYI